MAIAFSKPFAGCMKFYFFHCILEFYIISKFMKNCECIWLIMIHSNFGTYRSFFNYFKKLLKRIGKNWQDSARLDKTRQDSTRLDKTRQDPTRLDKTRQFGENHTELAKITPNHPKLLKIAQNYPKLPRI